MLSVGGISVVLGVLNEEDNVQELLDSFDRIISENNLHSINELVFVDDGSTDSTKEIIRRSMNSGHSYRIKLVERWQKMGMVNACITGSQQASNRTVIVMDSDLQHPLEAVPRMIEKSRGKSELIIASRYMKGGSNSWSPVRGVISRGAVFMSHIFLPATRGVKDPISGYFMTDVKYISCLFPYADSYKLALYIMAANPSISVEEVPFTMVDRERGSSKIVDKNFLFLLKYMMELIRYWRISAKIYARIVLRDFTKADYNSH
ncbi:hypothetical protein IX51_09405 [uncultured archaeon]|nr:hypothetical protein IX51_09405 [uncultured archaeon]